MNTAGIAWFQLLCVCFVTVYGRAEHRAGQKGTLKL